MLATVMNFFGSPFFNIVGGISTILMISGFFYTACLVLKGVVPVWYRLGIGLSTSTIAVFASSSEFSSLKSMLVDSKIFKEKNIMKIHGNDIDKAKGAKIFLVHWKDFQNEMSKILVLKEDSTALIIYAPQKEGRIDSQETLNQINQKRNSVIVNFRGRLMNDILTSLITANYGR